MAQAPVHIWLYAAAGISLALALFAFFPRRPRNRCCPRCRYDLSATAPPSSPPKCPECGHTARLEADLHRTPRRKKLAAVLLLLALAAAFAAVPRLTRATYLAVMPTWTTSERLDVPGYGIRILDRTDDQFPGYPHAIEIKDSRGQLLFHMDGMHFEVGNTGYGGSNRALGIAEDITGDGISDLIISHNPGGSGCFQTHFIFQLGSPSQDGSSFMPLATLDACGYFEDKDHNGIPEFIAAERAFAYRWTSGAGSPHPLVILRWSGYHYVVATDLMRKPAPSESELATLASQAMDLKLDVEERRSLSLMTALDLIYSGHHEQGMAFLRNTWPERQELDGFLKEFTEALNASPYADDIQNLQQSP